MCVHVSRCDCSEHGSCSPLNGSCSCEDGWEGPSCNDSMATTVTSTGSTPTTTDTGNNGSRVTSPTLSSTQRQHSTGAQFTHISIRQTSKEESDPSIVASTSGEQLLTTTCDYSLRTLSIAVVIGAGSASVLLHLLVCWFCQRRYESREHQRTRQPMRRKRRKLRKKPPFMRIPLQSSSDCSI